MSELNENPRWLTAEEQHLWRLLLHAMRKIDRTLEDTLQSTEQLSSSEFAVMVALSEHEEQRMRLRELCSALSWDRSRASHQISRMEKRGLVEKLKAEGDARGVLVAITPEGLRRLEKAAPEHVEVVRRLVFDCLKHEDLPAIEGFLSAIVESKVCEA